MKGLGGLEGFLLKDDPLYKECIQLATMSKGNMRFGSVLVKDGKIIGRGWNRQVKKEDYANKLPIIMGYANHAEVEAMNDALSNGFDVSYARIYVAGYFPKDGSLYIPRYPSFTCTRCPIYLGKYGISEVSIPSYSGWKTLSLDEARMTAKDFYGRSQSRRKAIGKSGVKLDMVLI